MGFSKVHCRNHQGYRGDQIGGTQLESFRFTYWASICGPGNFPVPTDSAPFFWRNYSCLFYKQVTLVAAAAQSPNFLAAGWACDSSQNKQSSFPGCVRVELRKEGLSHYSDSLRKEVSLADSKWPHRLCIEWSHYTEMKAERASPSGVPIWGDSHPWG